MDWQTLRRDSGLVMLIVVGLFVALGFFVFWLAFKLILMGVRGEFTILAGFEGMSLYITSISPGIFLIIAIAFILWKALPCVLHPRQC
ncbi:MAG: hypothetical protein AUJ70_01485 [Candidatus Omnitrophica bacterium CG1_02_40_15]|nr:MAG: hypothetical protein AUJ70_01485 [Candidatus Omnitrophica bacterium CG1_02_40_15]